MSAASEFQNAMREHGLEPPEVIEPGRLHRFAGVGKKRGDDSAWCRLFPDEGGGVYGDWSTGLSENWQAKRDRPYSLAESEAFQRQCETARREREERDRQKHVLAAHEAARLLEAATGDPAQHPYWLGKGVPFGPRVKRGAWPQRQWDDALLIPVYGGDPPELWTLSAISPDGKKDYLKGGEKRGGFHPLGLITNATRVWIGEGLADCAVVHMVDGTPCAVGLDAGGLPAVAEAVRKLAAPGAAIGIIVDNDLRDDGRENVGLTAATKAALAVGGLMAVPELDGRKCDFWDVWKERGADAVRACLETAQTPAEPHAESSGGDWPEPVPLPEGLPKVMAFDFALLPGSLRPWAQDICERVQCPADFVAVTILTALGAVIGRKLGIRPQAHTDWTESPNLWAMLVGRPGVLKSPAMEQALGPLKRLETRAMETHMAAASGHNARAVLFRLQQESAASDVKKKLAKGGTSEAELLHDLDLDEPELPALRRYKTNDSTAAALGELHRQNPNGLLVYRDEVVSLLKGLDREDNAEARGFYLTGWNGNSPYTFDRIGRGLNLYIPAVCLSLLGSTQPGRIAEYIGHAVKGGAGDDGLIQRFGLLVWPDTGGDWRNVDRWPDSKAKQAAFEVFDLLDKLDPKAVSAMRDIGYDGEPEGLPYLRFDAGGLELFTDWRGKLETRLRGGELHPAMESHLAKYRKLVPGLALILHLADGGTGPVTERATCQALAWAEYLETHAVRAYASVTTPEVSTAKAILHRIHKGDLSKTFSSRDVWRPGWANLTDSAAVADALRLLVDYQWLDVTRVETGGRTATVYEVNPRAQA